MTRRGLPGARVWAGEVHQPWHDTLDRIDLAALLHHGACWAATACLAAQSPPSFTLQAS